MKLNLVDCLVAKIVVVDFVAGQHERMLALHINKHSL